MTECENCLYYEYDETQDVYGCDMELDMDEAARFMLRETKGCPFYRPGDEYTIVRKQN